MRKFILPVFFALLDYPDLTKPTREARLKKQKRNENKFIARQAKTLNRDIQLRRRQAQGCRHRV